MLSQPKQKESKNKKPKKLKKPFSFKNLPQKLRDYSKTTRDFPKPRATPQKPLPLNFRFPQAFQIRIRQTKRMMPKPQTTVRTQRRRMPRL
jgi:hypothetical protein